MRKVLFKRLLDVSAPFGLHDNACVVCCSPQDCLKEKREFQTPKWLPRHQIHTREIKAGSFHHSCMMSLVIITGCPGLQRDSPVKMCLFFTCHVSLQVRVRCWSLQECHSGTRQSKPNQSPPKSPQWAAGSPVCRDIHLQLVRNFSVDNAGVIFKITTYICEQFQGKDLP